MDLRKIKTLIDLVRESGVAELEVNEGEDHLRIVNTHGTASPLPAGTVLTDLSAFSAPAAAVPAVPAAGSRSGCRGSCPAARSSCRRARDEPDGRYVLPFSFA